MKIYQISKPAPKACTGGPGVAAKLLRGRNFRLRSGVFTAAEGARSSAWY